MSNGRPYCEYPQHAATTAYNYGCRCEDCLRAKSDLARDYRFNKMNPVYKSCPVCETSYQQRNGSPNPLCRDCYLKYRRVLQSFIQHHASWDQIVTWLINPSCWICEKPIDGIMLSSEHNRPQAKRIAFAVDHDHRCCDDHYSCGRCIRGIAHPHCNTRIGMLESLINELGFIRVAQLAGQVSA